MRRNNKLIARIIAKKIFDELSSKENEELDSWLSDDQDNRRLHNEIMKSNTFHEWLLHRKTGTESAWENIYKTIKKKKNNYLFHKSIRIAASVIIPLLIGIGFYFYIVPQLPVSNEFVQEESKINPGTSKAVLIMADGESVVLDTPEDMEIIEKDGTKIKKAEKKLDYSQVKSKESTELLFNSLQIPTGAEYNLILSDGTKVFLNAMTEFKYPVKFNDNIREVELSGEAYFEVAKTGVPFIVKTDQINVEAIGTSFNVNSYQNTNKVITTLVEGKVKVSNAKEPSQNVILLPAEQAVHNLPDGSLEVNEVDVILYTAWKDGEFVFYDTRLEDLMTTLTRWYSANVFYLNPSVKELRFSGSLNRYDDIDQILDIIRSTKKLRVEVNGTSILFSERL